MPNGNKAATRRELDNRNMNDPDFSDFNVVRERSGGERSPWEAAGAECNVVLSAHARSVHRMGAFSLGRPSCSKTARMSSLVLSAFVDVSMHVM